MCEKPLPECRMWMKNMETMIRDMHRVMLGNGQPKSGLADRMTRVETIMVVLIAVVAIGTAGASALAAWIK